MMRRVSESGPTRARLKQLDILRAIAIFLILGADKYVSTVWMQVGWIGVDLFFVVSSFLVSGILFNEYKKFGKINFRHFFFRRGLKIYPTFYLFLFITILYQGLVLKTFRFTKIISEFFFIQNYGSPLWSHTWFLAVDQHFYLFILPTCLTLLCNYTGNRLDPFKPIGRIFILIAFWVLALRIATAVILPYDYFINVTPTHLRFDSLMFGVVLSYFYQFQRVSFSSFIRENLAPLFALSCALIFPVFLFDLEGFFMHTIGFTLLYLGLGGLLMVCLYWDEKLPIFWERMLNPVGDVLGLIGIYSYSIYLWHLPVGTWGSDLLRQIYPYPIHFLVEFAIYFAASILVGILMAKLIEKPVLKFRDRVYPSRSSGILSSSQER